MVQHLIWAASLIRGFWCPLSGALLKPRGIIPQRTGKSAPVIGPYGVFETAEGPAENLADHFRHVGFVYAFLLRSAHITGRPRVRATKRNGRALCSVRKRKAVTRVRAEKNSQQTGLGQACS